MSSSVQKKHKATEIIILYWVPVLLWAAVIFTFSSFPTGTASEIDWQDFIVKKSAHVVVYFILTSLTYRALLVNGVSKSKAAFLSILFSVLYGFSDEFHQSFTPGRDPRIRDVLFDAVGAVLAIYSIWNIVPRAPEKIRKLVEEMGFKKI